MSVKANDVVDMALKLISHVGDMGAIDKNRESRYYGVAPAYLTVLQYELAEYENAPPPLPVTNLTQELDVSDCGITHFFSLLEAFLFWKQALQYHY